jgi:SAM-dependent methyltransferase
MNTESYIYKLKNKIIFYSSLLSNIKEKYKCPICNYIGPFGDVNSPVGLRKHAKCPICGSLERHRIQFVVLKNLFHNMDTSSLKILHFAPEHFFRDFFFKRFGQYETADLNMIDVDHNVDLQELPFDDQSYDIVFASHVLEHIPNDIKAISEIKRILRPNGIAIIPVPLVVEKTIEYPAPNQSECYHVRAPGLDYYDRYNSFFSKIELVSSDSLPTIHQLYIYEDRSLWPTKECPLRTPMNGEKHIDIIPICYL